MGRGSATLTFVHLDVDGAPPDLVLGRLLVDDTLVLGAATGLLSGKVDERSGGGDNSTFVPDGIFVQDCRGCVALDLDAVHVETGLGEVLQVTADD